MATEAEKRMHRCCFTGHRPEKLQAPEGVVTAALEKEIRQAIADGFNVFITGMARGVDIWAAEIVLRLRDAGEAVRLICACRTRASSEGGSRAGRNATRQSCLPLTSCGSSAQGTAAVASSGGMSGW